MDEADNVIDQVHRVGNRLGLHGRVDDHALQIGEHHGLDLHRAFDGRLEQLLDAVLAQQAPEAPDLGGVARQARLVVSESTEVCFRTKTGSGYQNCSEFRRHLSQALRCFDI